MHYYTTSYLSYADTSSNNNNLSSHEKNIIKKIKKKENTKIWEIRPKLICLTKNDT